MLSAREAEIVAESIVLRATPDWKEGYLSAAPYVDDVAHFNNYFAALRMFWFKNGKKWTFDETVEQMIKHDRGDVNV